MKRIQQNAVAAWVAMLSLAFPCMTSAQGSYAGQERRAIKALSQAEVDELLSGQGMGLAKAAELNGYPGPAHVLEHAQALQLTADQRRATEALMNAHKAKARALGAEVVQAERVLDQAFATREVDEAALARLTATIASKQAALREEHLRTHLAQEALLTQGQVSRYAQLRGYGSGAEALDPAPSSHGKHH